MGEGSSTITGVNGRWQQITETNETKQNRYRKRNKTEKEIDYARGKPQTSQSVIPSAFSNVQ